MLTEKCGEIPTEVLEKVTHLRFKIRRLQSYIDDNNLPFSLSLNTSNLMKTEDFDLRRFYRYFATQVSYSTATKEESNLTGHQQLLVNTMVGCDSSELEVLRRMIKKGEIT